MIADLAGDAAVRAGGGARSGAGPAELLRALRRAKPRRPGGVLQAAGALLATAGAGVVGAAVLGAIPGSLATVLLGLVAASAGARLALSDPTTRTLAARASADRLHGIPFEALMILALIAGFARWRAPDLEALRGAQAVLGPGLLVGPAPRAAALALAALAVAVAGGARVVRPGAGAPGRGLRPEGAAFVALARWSALGAGALAAAALAAGPELGSAGSWSAASRALPVWVLGVLVSGGLAGGACRLLGGRPARWRSRAVVLAALAAAVAGAFVLGAA